jgi:hypothetical protein
MVQTLIRGQTNEHDNTTSPSFFTKYGKEAKKESKDSR